MALAWPIQGYWRKVTGRSQSAGSPVHFRCAEPKVGSRLHVYLNRTRLAPCRDGHLPALTPCHERSSRRFRRCATSLEWLRRVVDGRDHDGPTGGGPMIMSIWRQGDSVTLPHSDQTSQYTNEQFQCLKQGHGMTYAMPLPGNCRDNAVMKELFSSFKIGRVRKRVCRSHNQAQSDVLD